MLTVGEALAAMQELVQTGAMLEAREIGAQACFPVSRTACPLSIPSDAIHFGAMLSGGAEGDVFAAELASTGESVAVKKLRLQTSDDLVRFRAELTFLSLLEHPNVVRLVGAKAMPPDYMIVLRRGAGNLRDMLYEEAWRPDWQTVIRIGIQVASALSAVHRLGIIHRDIKPSNLILAADRETVLLADFGVATRAAPAAGGGNKGEAASANPSSTAAEGGGYGGDGGVAALAMKGRRGRPSGGKHRLGGTLEYMSPEVLLKAPSSFASDVYAFAVTLNELATATVPFSDCTKENPEVHTVLELGYGRQELAAAVAAEGLRPMMAGTRGSRPPGYEDLLSRCWSKSPGARPTIDDVSVALASILDTLPAWEHGQQVAKSCLDAAVARKQDALPPGIEGADAAKEVAWEGPSSCFSISADSSTVANPGWIGSKSQGDVYRPVVTAGSFEAIGPRDSMEDRTLILVEEWGREALGRTDVSLFGVFDGHRGAQAANHCVENLPRLLADFCRSSASPQIALHRAFLALEQGYRDSWEAECAARLRQGKAGGQFPGCTAIVALLVGRDLYVANAGDCRAVLGKASGPEDCGEPPVSVLSRDHTAALEDERQRILRQGGQVTWQHNSWRIGGCGLQVSRSIGDFDQKPSTGAGGADAKALTAEPEISHVILSQEDESVILGSDGLWDVLGNTEAFGLVRDTVKDAMLGAKRLVTEALARGSNDNVSAVLVYLRPVSTLEQVFGQGKQKHRAASTHYGSRRGQQARAAINPAVDELKDTY